MNHSVQQNRRRRAEAGPGLFPGRQQRAAVSVRGGVPTGTVSKTPRRREEWRENPRATGAAAVEAGKKASCGEQQSIPPDVATITEFPGTSARTTARLCRPRGEQRGGGRPIALPS